jgi:hypothetical protein
MFSWIISPIKWLVSQISRDFFGYLEKKQDIDLEKYRENSDVLTEAMKADVEIAKIRQLQAINDNSNWMTRWIRPAFALPPVVYYAAIVYDCVFVPERDFVQRVPDEVNTVFGVILTFYFGTRVVEKIADKYMSRK